MQNNTSKLFKTAFTCLSIVLLAAICYCQDKSTSPDESSPLTSMLGSWGATTIDGSLDPDGNPLDVNADISTWVFNDDSTYRWFLHAPPYYDIEGGGNYYLAGDTLYLEGIAANLCDLGEHWLLISGNSMEFRFRDSDNDLWIYEKIQPD